MGLFDELPDQSAPERPAGKARVQEPVRDQVALVMSDLDALVGPDHPVRRVWAFVEGLDLSALYAAIRVREGTVGRAAIDPKILMALWLFAAIDGVGSARAVARLCTTSAPYRWLCGGVGVNHHALSDFRVAHTDFLDEVLATSVAVLAAKGLVQLEELAQDGMRLRASAGASSFRRLPTLGKAMKQARKRIARLKRELDDDPDAGNRRRRAAEERAAREAEERVAKALEEMERLKAERERARNKPTREPRVSTTDPEARVIKMADGGFRPGWNAQVVSDPLNQVVVAVDVTASSSDRGLVRPMIERVRRRFGRSPKRWLADGGYTDRADIDWAASPEGGGVKVYSPLPRSKHKNRPPEAPRPDDGPGAVDWRRRMATPTGKAIYRHRAQCECIHAHWRRQGLVQVLVRGAEKVRAVLLWHAIAHNITRLAPA